MSENTIYRKLLVYFFGLYFLAYTVLLLFDLQLIPLVWFDEVMGLDPAVNFVYGDGLQSSIWPQTGTEEQYMAYLPMRFWVHIINLSLVPVNVYLYRLPWVLFSLAALFLIYKTFRAMSLPLVLSLFLVFFVANEQVFFEMTRSMRVDPLAYLLLAACIFSRSSGRHLAQALLSIALVFVHPYVWLIALVSFSDAIASLLKSADKRKAKLIVVGLFGVSMLTAFLNYIHFDFQLFFSQLFEHKDLHDADGGLLSRLQAHFIGRFFTDFSKLQFFVPFVYYLAFIMAVYDLLKRNWNTLAMMLVGTHLYWLITLAPFYRYNGILLIVSVVYLAGKLAHIKEIGWNFSLAIPMILFCIFFSAEVMGRHAMAINLYKFRDPKPVLTWLNSNLSKEDQKTLIFGSNVAYYATIGHQNREYMLYNSAPEKFNFADYDEVLCLSHDTLNQPELKLVSERHLKYVTLTALGTDLPNYRNLYLYKIDSEEDYKELLNRLLEDKLP